MVYDDAAGAGARLAGGAGAAGLRLQPAIPARTNADTARRNMDRVPTCIVILLYSTSDRISPPAQILKQHGQDDDAAGDHQLLGGGDTVEIENFAQIADRERAEK